MLIKPNLLSARTPEKRITTDPAMVRAVTRMVLDAGGKPVIGDSPALEPFKRVAEKCGMAEVAEELGVELAALTNPRPVSLPEGFAFKQLEIASLALDTDVVINLPKLKTHCQMLLTLGVKNLFGAIVASARPNGTTWQMWIGIHLPPCSWIFTSPWGRP